jgi:hypothetical protein
VNTHSLQKIKAPRLWPARNARGMRERCGTDPMDGKLQLQISCKPAACVFALGMEMAMFAVRTSTAAVVLVAALLGEAEAQNAFAITPSWEGIAACNGRPVSSPSPKFRVANAPAGAVQLEFKMSDLDAPLFSHGGGKVAYGGGSEIAAGAFTFTGPCPPATHRYEWSVVARDAQGKSLGTAKAVIKYP